MLFFFSAFWLATSHEVWYLCWCWCLVMEVLRSWVFLGQKNSQHYRFQCTGDVKRIGGRELALISPVTEKHDFFWKFKFFKVCWFHSQEKKHLPELLPEKNSCDTPVSSSDSAGDLKHLHSDCACVCVCVWVIHKKKHSVNIYHHLIAFIIRLLNHPFKMQNWPRLSFLWNARVPFQRDTVVIPQLTQNCIKQHCDIWIYLKTPVIFQVLSQMLGSRMGMILF